MHNVLNRIDKFVRCCCDLFYVTESVWEVFHTLFRTFMIFIFQRELLVDSFSLNLLFILSPSFCLCMKNFFPLFTSFFCSFKVSSFFCCAQNLKWMNRTVATIFVLFALKLNSSIWFVSFLLPWKNYKYIWDCILNQSKKERRFQFNRLYFLMFKNVAHRNWK